VWILPVGASCETNPEKPIAWWVPNHLDITDRKRAERLMLKEGGRADRGPHTTPEHILLVRPAMPVRHPPGGWFSHAEFVAGGSL